MKLAILFDGAGLARLGLEQAGHECDGFELDPTKHHLSTMVGSGRSFLMDATAVDLSHYDGVWASPPCQTLSQANRGVARSEYATNYLAWCLSLVDRYPEKVIWVENVTPWGVKRWGTLYNAAQFMVKPIQGRQRQIGGNYIPPFVYREYKRKYADHDLCPAITATEYKGSTKSYDWRASRYLGRRLTLDECAYYQGFTIPDDWYTIPRWYVSPKGSSPAIGWRNSLYEAIGNGVPPYMSKQFGLAYNTSHTYIEQKTLI